MDATIETIEWNVPAKVQPRPRILKDFEGFCRSLPPFLRAAPHHDSFNRSRCRAHRDETRERLFRACEFLRGY
jgi:hypothetical protein